MKREARPARKAESPWFRNTWISPVRRDAAVNLAAGIVMQALVVVSGVLAARILGVHDRGVFAFLWVFALIIAMGTSLGLPVAVTYWVARAPAASGAMARSLLPAAAIQGTCALLVHGVVVYLGAQGMVPCSRCALLSTGGKYAPGL